MQEHNADSKMSSSWQLAWVEVVSEFKRTLNAFVCGGNLSMPGIVPVTLKIYIVWWAQLAAVE